MVKRPLLLIFALVAILLAFLPAGPGGAAALEGEGTATGSVVALGLGDGGLTWSERPGADPASAGALDVDLTELDPAALAGDVVRLEVLAIEGPGRLDVWSTGPHGRPAHVVAGALPSAAAPIELAAQAGRRTGMRWTFDRPGPHRLTVRATAPLAGGGTASVAVARTFGADPDLEVLDEAGVVASVEAASAAAVASRSVDDGRGAGSGARQAPAGGARVIISDGHIDIGPRIVDGFWRVQLKDDTGSPPVWRELADVVLHVTDDARIEVPDREAYAFLGAPGTPYHLLPQTQQAGIVWPGWNSQDPAVVEAVPGSVTWRLRGVEGPGRFAIFLTDSFGETQVLLDSDRSMPQDLEIPRNSHVHGNWAFGAPGVYRLQVEMRAALAAGGTASDVRTLTVAVGDGTDPGAVTPPGDDAGPGQAIDDDADGPGVSITTDLDPEGGGSGSGSGGGAGGSGSTGGGGGGGGALATTGSAVASLVPWALLLLLLGGLARLTSRLAMSKNKNHS